MSPDKDVTDHGLENGHGNVELRDELPDLQDYGAEGDGAPDSLDDKNDLKEAEDEADREEQGIQETILLEAKEEPSTPDDTLSLQDSLLSSPRRPRLGSPSHSFRPFDRRFTARLSPSPLASPRPASPAFLTGRSRHSSALNPFPSSENGDGDSAETPWEVLRWTKLRKLSGDAFSEIGKRNYGRPNCMAVASLVAIGTSKGLILIFDFHQNLKTVIGLGTKAIESGAVTAIALSADYSIVAGGHANGNIFTWDIARPAKPFLSILATSISQVQSSDSNGHITDVAVLHLSFLGTRHTALVSADVKGMAFSHLATRGLGSIARSVRTSRILGRYPESEASVVKPRKPSSVLAFSSMPLGNSETAADELGIVAMLTPYLLVIVSTTPIAQTQHKAVRPKDIGAHGAMTGTLAWYPAMRSKTSSSNPKLAYCWLNTIFTIEVVEIPNEAEKDSPPELRFKTLQRWQAEESIVAMQWLSRSVLAILTITQQLIVLEDTSMTVTDSSDLIKRHIYHADLFSHQLSSMIESLDQEDTTMHGVVADAFYMSFKAYKGRLFLLGFNDISIGTLSNWADRLLALMQQGDFIGAIQLASSYYLGGPEQAAIGLPLDETTRHELVQEKLLEMMAASLRYAFGKNPDTDARVSDTQLEHLARACFTSCLQLDDMDFLFEDVYTWYAENNTSRIFLDILESYIDDGSITMVPPIVLKDLVSTFINQERSSKLEEILCLLDPATMDIEQVTLLCRKFKLYDALFYIWSQALSDYTTVLKNLLAASQSNNSSNNEQAQSKIFPFLSYTLTGRIYPTGDMLSDNVAFKAKSDIYHFLFSGSVGESYIYLKQALDLDTPSFLSMLNEAYEDSFLDGSIASASETNGYTKEEQFALSLTRQYIIRVLLEVLVQPAYDIEDTIYLDMFVARNQAKFPQFIRLPGGVLQKTMVNLCLYPSEEIAEDCQLSLEYLLSVYQPPDVLSLLPELEEARFYRVIKSIYRSEKQYSKLLETCFRDEDHPDGVFECIRDYLRPGSDLSLRERDQFRHVLTEHVEGLLSIDIHQTATTLDVFGPDLHPIFITSLESDKQRQYEYLKPLLESESVPDKEQKAVRDAYIEQYIQLLCDINPHHVSEYINGLDSSDLQLDQVLPALEHSGIIDAAVMLLAKGGRLEEAMKRLIKHLKYLETALTSLMDGISIAPDLSNMTEAADDLVDSVEKYNKIGIWLCNLQGADKAVKNQQAIRLSSQALDESLSTPESSWLELIDAIVNIVKNSNVISTESEELPEKNSNNGHQGLITESLQRLRSVVQDTFTALLAATSTSSKHSAYSNMSFLRILRALLSRMSKSSPSLLYLRGVLSSVFSAYAYEENLLRLSNRLLDKDLFVRVEEITDRRKRGWRPLNQTCNRCQLRVWGPGTGIDAWNAWYTKAEDDIHRPRGAITEENKNQLSSGTRPDSASIPSLSAKGKGKEIVGTNHVDQSGGSDHKEDKSNKTFELDDATKQGDSLIIFSCRHIWHRDCLRAVIEENITSDNAGSVDDQLRCPLEIIVT